MNVEWQLEEPDPHLYHFLSFEYINRVKQESDLVRQLRKL